MLVYLIGYMGSGKSTLGKKLANRLGFDFIDLDKAIESKTGKQVHEIFADRGEEYFRATESEVLRSVSGESDTVISCGGGTPCHGNNMEFMNRKGLTVYLEMTAAALLSRLKNSGLKRPLIAGMNITEQENFISASLKEREVYYKKSRITVSGLNPDITQLSSLLRAQGSYNP